MWIVQKQLCCVAFRWRRRNKNKMCSWKWKNSRLSIGQILRWKRVLEMQSQLLLFGREVSEKWRLLDWFRVWEWRKNCNCNNGNFINLSFLLEYRKIVEKGFNSLNRVFEFLLHCTLIFLLLGKGFFWP